MNIYLSMQQHGKLVSSGSRDYSFKSEGEVSGVTDEKSGLNDESKAGLRDKSKAATMGLHDKSKAVAFGLSRCDHLAPEKKSSTQPKMVGMEKTIYVHVICMGESVLKEALRFDTGFKDATNDWYVIKRGCSGQLKMLQVFEDINQFNYPGPALDYTGCQVIGSCIYVIGGRSVLNRAFGGGYVKDRGSSMIRCLDTRNPRKGWMTLPLTLPFAVSEVGSVVVDDQWLYLLGGFHGGGPRHWGYALNVRDVNCHGKKEHKARIIIQPGTCSGSPIVSTSFSPGTLFAYKEWESTLYCLDCTNNAWTVYEKGLPYTLSEVLGGAAASDGILYIYDSFDMHFIAYDIPNRRQLYLIDLPNSFWFGREETINLIVLAKNKFCILWQQEAEELNHMNIYYVGFSVSFDHLNKPTIVTEEKQSFYIGAYTILNVVAV